MREACKVRMRSRGESFEVRAVVAGQIRKVALV